MKLWCNIAIDRAGCIVLKLGGDKFPSGLGRMIAADPGLRIVFQLVEGNANALSMRFADTLIPADKGSQRDRLGAEKLRECRFRVPVLSYADAAASNETKFAPRRIVRP